SAIGGLSSSDPEAAARQIALMTAGPAKNQAISDVAQNLARLNPQAAGDLLKQQGNPEELGGPMRQLMPVWVNQNANAALQYANSYEPGKARDDALQSWVWSNNSSEPAALVKVAETITDENDRTRAISVAAARWMKEDPEAAKNYVQQSTILSDAEKSRIIEGRGMRGGGRGRGQ
ncbi:MAG: hypothetical protein H8M99_04440, partial [Gloeobacteraceae cyanobacterium ES-bin-144]|nr:hypothetical protein [Verrucomicrobiales bacterium]